MAAAGSNSALAGVAEFKRLFHLEQPTADMNSKGGSYKQDRQIAIAYLANLRVKKPKEFVREYYEAAYMALNLFDRLYGKIGNVIEPSEDNTSLFLTCCFTLSWKILKSEQDLLMPYTQQLLYKGSNLEGVPLDFTEVNVKQMESNMLEHLHLEPPLQHVMPFAYLPPLTQLAHEHLPPLNKCNQPLYRLIWKSQDEIALSFTSSELAVAAFLVFVSKEYTRKIDAFESSILELDVFASSEKKKKIKKCKLMMAKLYDELAEMGVEVLPDELDSCLPEVVNLMLGAGLQAAATCCRIQ